MTSQNKFNKELLLVALIKCLGLLSCLSHCFWNMETQDSLMLSQVQNVDQFTLVWKKKIDERTKLWPWTEQKRLFLRCVTLESEKIGKEHSEF